MKRFLIIFLITLSFVKAQDITFSDLTETTSPMESWIMPIESPLVTYKITLTNVYNKLLGRTNEWTGQNTFNKLTRIDSTMLQRGTNYWSSETFIPGWTGNGWKLDYGVTSSGVSNLELDNLTVRGSMSVYELLIKQIRATNGNVLITTSGKVLATGTGADTVNVAFEDATGNGIVPFIKNDIIRAQKYTNLGSVIRTVDAIVDTIVNYGSTQLAIVTYYTSNHFLKGDEVIRLGNTTDTTRQGTIYLAAADNGAPFIDVLSGINSQSAWSDSSKIKVRIGKLQGMTVPSFGALAGYGFYTNNAYLDNAYVRGNIILTNPAEVLDSLGGGVNVSTRWDSITFRPVYFDTPSGSGLFLSASHFGFYSSSTWKNYFDSTGNVVVGNIGAGGAGFSWNQTGGTLSVAGSIKVLNKAEVSDTLGFTITIYAYYEPSTRPNGTALRNGDVWIHVGVSNKKYVRDGGAWVAASDSSLKPVYTTGTSFPATPKEDDWHWWTGVEGTYHKNSWYRYSGAAWESKGLYGTYIDDAGLYTGTVACTQLLAGTITAALEIDAPILRSSATMTVDRGYANEEPGFWLGKYGTGDYRLWIGSSRRNSMYYNNNTFTIRGGNIAVATITSTPDLSYDNCIAGTNPGFWLGNYSPTAITGITVNATTDIFTKIGNGFVNNQVVMVIERTGFVNPGLFTPFYIVNVSGFNFQISSTLGGAAFDVSISDGTCTMEVVDYRLFIGKSATQYLAYDNTNLTVMGGSVIAGIVRGGMTSYSDASNAGYWMGLDGATPKFKIRKDATHYIYYDGMDFAVFGATIGGSVIASDDGKDYADTENGFWLGKYGTDDYRFEIYNSSTKYFRYDNTDISLVGGIITGGTVRTATSGQRVELTSANGLRFIGSDANYSTISQEASTGLATSGSLTVNGGLLTTGNVAGNTISSTTYIIAQSDLYGRTSLNIGDPAFSGAWNLIINSSGQLTKVNNLAASSYTNYFLISDGTSYTPTTWGAKSATIGNTSTGQALYWRLFAGVKFVTLD